MKKRAMIVLMNLVEWAFSKRAHFADGFTSVVDPDIDGL